MRWETDKTVLVTGATRGVGLATARRLAKEGYRVVATGRNPTEELSELMSECDWVFFEPFDLRQIPEVRDFVGQLQKSHGVFWGVVNNAAAGLEGVLAGMDETDIDCILRVNIHAPILLTKYLSQSMLAKRRGRIVNIASIIAATGFHGLSVYGASKAALVGFTKSLARELGSEGITVNAIAPGAMETDMTASLRGEPLDRIRQRTPLGRLAEPSDIASAVRYLLSDEASMITGTVLTVDGGSTA